jgi:trigger factor
MQVSIETTSGLERRLTVGVPAAEVEDAVSERIEKAARTIRLNGFRPGRVPVKVVRQRFGSAIRQEVIGETLSRTFQDAVSREGIRPAGPPRIDPLRDEPGEDLEYTAVFEVYPEVRLGDLTALEIVKPVASVNAADVDAMIERLRDQRASWEEVERPAALGDRARIDYRGTRDGEAVAGGSAEGAELVLGSGRMIPGFEDAVVGMAAGDRKTVTLTFPEDYQEESLRGAEVEFEIALQSVKEKHLPEVDAEFLKAFGIEDGDLERFRSEVQRNMERELNTALRSKLKSRTLEQLLASHDVDLPQALVAEEIKVVRRQMVAQFGGGANFDESMLPDDLFADQASRRVKLGLIVAEIVKSAEIRVDEARVRERLAEIAAGYEDPEQVMRYYLSNEDALNALQGAVMEDQVVDHLVAGAKVIEEPLDYEAALKPDPAPAGEGD